MARHTYIAEFEPAPDGGYGIHFPDLPGCTSAADSLDQAVAHATEALALHLDGMIEDGTALPFARPLSDLILSDDRAPNGVWAAISAEVEDGGERVNIYLPKSLLARIERFGQETGIDNRSTFLRLAARAYLQREDRQPPSDTSLRDRLALAITSYFVEHEHGHYGKPVVFEFGYIDIGATDTRDIADRILREMPDLKI